MGRVVALPRHTFVTGATLLQLVLCNKSCEPVVSVILKACFSETTNFQGRRWITESRSRRNENVLDGPQNMEGVIPTEPLVSSDYQHAIC